MPENAIKPGSFDNSERYFIVKKHRNKVVAPLYSILLYKFVKLIVNNGLHTDFQLKNEMQKLILLNTEVRPKL